MYESPINLVERATKSLAEEIDNDLVLTIEKEIGWAIDKEELLKALQYDRDQYYKGYHDGKLDNQWTFIGDTLKLPKLYSTYSDPIRKYDCRWSKDVLLCGKSKDIRVGYWLSSKYFTGWKVYGGTDGYEPIAWMYLPKPCKMERDE